MHCQLCQTPGARLVLEKGPPGAGAARYYQCGTCRLIFLAPEFFLSKEEERQRYDLHENDPGDAGYAAFLEQLAAPLHERLTENSDGLDYGCGPGPALSGLLKERGHRVADYDPVYYPDGGLLERPYDFITATEVIEHFYRPRAEFERLDAMIKPGGLIGLMTAMYIDIERFKGWWYHREPTHVCFYHGDTLAWIGQWLGWQIEYLTGRVVIYRKHEIS